MGPLPQATQAAIIPAYASGLYRAFIIVEGLSIRKHIRRPRPPGPDRPSFHGMVQLIGMLFREPTLIGAYSELQAGKWALEKKIGMAPYHRLRLYSY